MAKLTTIKTKSGDVTFLFGVRFITLLQEQLGLKTFEEIGERLASPTFRDIALILFCAHENACFFLRKELTIENADFMHYLMDEIGIEKPTQIMTDGIQELFSVMEGKTVKKKVTPK